MYTTVIGYTWTVAYGRLQVGSDARKAWRMDGEWRQQGETEDDCRSPPVTHRNTGAIVITRRIAVRKHTWPLRELTCHTYMGSHSVTCHPVSGDIPAFSLRQPINAGTRFTDPGRMHGWVDLVGLVTCRGGIPARRRSIIHPSILTWLNVSSSSNFVRATNDATHTAKLPLNAANLHGEIAYFICD